MKKQVSLDYIISALTKDYERLFWCDVHTGEIRLLPNTNLPKAYEFLLDQYLTHDEKIRLFANKVVYSVDRTDFIKKMASMKIIEAFDSGKDSYAVRYRGLKDTGDFDFFEAKIFKAPSENDDLCCVYAFRNVNDIVLEEGIKAVEEENNKTFGIVNALANDYESILIVDVITDELSVYRLGNGIKNYAPNLNEIHSFEELTNFIVNNYVPTNEMEQFRHDVKRGSILEGLAHGQVYRTKLTTVNNGIIQHWEVKFAYGNEAHSIVVCGIRNIGDKISETEEKKQFLQDHAKQKAFVDLFADSYISAYYINLIDGAYRVYKSPSNEPQNVLKPTRPNFNDALFDFAKSVPEEKEKEEFIRSASTFSIKSNLRKANEYSYDFRISKQGEIRYLRLRAIKGHDANHAALGFIDITEEHLKEVRESEMRRQNAIISSLTSDFELVNYVEIRDGEDNDVVTYSRLSSIFSMFAEIEEEKLLHNRLEYIKDNIVLADDRDDFSAKTKREVIIPELRQGHPYFVTFRAGFFESAAYYQVKFTPDLDAAGFLKGFVVGIHSIDDQMKKEFLSRVQAEDNLKTINKQKKELEESHALLEAANNSKTAFLFNMSHDIRTPMNAITGFADLAEKHIDEKEKVLDYLTKISTASDHLLRLINEVLDMSRVEAGKITSEITNVYLVDATNELYLLCAESAKERGIDISFDSGNVPNYPISADVLHVNRILLNVLSNAIKYTKPGGRIRFSTKLIENQEPGFVGVSFICEDTGIGMSKEYLSHIYDSFSREQTSTVSGVEGTGLGMAIVKKLVDFLNGSIDIQSEVDVGTTVVVNLTFKINEQTER